jgi:signal transduction histidine kinase
MEGCGLAPLARAEGRTVKRFRAALAGPLLMPPLVWAVVLLVQRQGIPDQRLRLADLRPLDPALSTGAVVVGPDGATFSLRPDAGRTDFTLRRTFVRETQTGTEPLALYVPSVERNVEVFLNGAKVGDGGRLDPPVERNRHRPLFFPIPAALFRRGDNALDLRVVGAAHDPGFILPVYLGPRRLLEPAYQWHYAFKVTSMQMIVGTILLLALFSGALWWKRPAETVYGWFAGGLVCWAVYNLHYVLTRWPLSPAAWTAVIHAALGGFLYCMILFVHRLVGLRPARLERVFLWLTVSTIAALLAGAAVLDAVQLWGLINAGYRWILLALGAYLLFRLVRMCLRQRAPALYWLGSATALTFSFGVHDSLRQLGILDSTVPNLMQYGGLATLVVFGYLLVDRFANALRESEELNVSLDRKVQEKTRALAEQFEKTRALERERVLAQERERLVRDMHDGMGGQLISVLNLVRSGHQDRQLLEDVLLECIQDLKLMIDSMDTAGDDLAVALGMLRARLEPRLRATGLEIHWDTRQVPDGLCLGSEGVLHVFRILQESIQNAIKHAHARTLWIEARAGAAGSPPAVELSVRDDGVGLRANARRGRGLGNMRHRAQQIGATLSVDAAHPGTRVTLSLPTPS